MLGAHPLNCLGRVRRCVLVGGGMFLAAGLSGFKWFPHHSKLTLSALGLCLKMCALSSCSRTWPACLLPCSCHDDHGLCLKWETSLQSTLPQVSCLDRMSYKKNKKVTKTVLEFVFIFISHDNLTYTVMCLLLSSGGISTIVVTLQVSLAFKFIFPLYLLLFFVCISLPSVMLWVRTQHFQLVKWMLCH